SGMLDALTFSRYIVEAFDHSEVRYIISASPTSSTVDMGQLCGRGARLGEDKRLTMLFCLIDNLISGASKKLQTPFHVYCGDNDFYQGMILAPANRPSPGFDTRQSTPDGSFLSSGGRDRQAHDTLDAGELTRTYSGLSRQVRAAMADLPPGTILDELLIV